MKFSLPAQLRGPETNQVMQQAIALRRKLEPLIGPINADNIFELAVVLRVGGSLGSFGPDRIENIAIEGATLTCDVVIEDKRWADLDDDSIARILDDRVTEAIGACLSYVGIPHDVGAFKTTTIGKSLNSSRVLTALAVAPLAAPVYLFVLSLGLWLIPAVIAVFDFDPATKPTGFYFDSISAAYLFVATIAAYIMTLCFGIAAYTFLYKKNRARPIPLAAIGWLLAVAVEQLLSGIGNFQLGALVFSAWYYGIPGAVVAVTFGVIAGLSKRKA